MRPIGWVIAVIAFCLGSGGPSTASDYPDLLIDQAKARQLAKEPGWLALGHYRPAQIGTGQQSLIDSPAFFLAPDGKSNPTAELEATLRAFFKAPVDDDSQTAKDASLERQHPQCRFVARYRWLKARLNFDQGRLAEQLCDDFESWSETIAADSATLIFPAAYLNSPASMFGHTLLRFDRQDQTEEIRLLSYAVNYGANTGEDNGILFAVLGMTGGYPGTYSVEPYYNLVKLYNDIENRDIWEYQLDFSKAEVARMVAHLWEMQGHHSDYYFFDENCSYQLLFLLDVARPSLGLVDDFPVHVIPIDSVRSVLKQKGLLRQTRFRPSGETRIQHELAGLSANEQDLLQRLTTAEISPEHREIEALTPQRQAAVLELAEAFVTYQMETGDLLRDDAAKRAWSLLAARSQIQAKSDQPEPATPQTRPDQGHRSARFAAGLGVRDGKVFQALRLRPAYHDNLDPSGGYLPGAAIEFLDLELRHYQGGSAVALERLTVIGIHSMTPRNQLIQPISWHLNTGLERLRIEGTDEEGALIGVLEGGAGVSSSLFGQDITSLTLDAGISAGEDCDDTCSVNIGPAFSIIWPMTDQATFAAKGRFQGRFGKGTDERFDLRLGQSYGVTSDIAVKIEAGIEDEGGGAQTELLTTLNWYF